MINHVSTTWSSLSIPKATGFVQVFRRQDFGRPHFPLGKMSALLADFIPLLRGVVFLSQPDLGASLNLQGMRRSPIDGRAQ